MRGGLPATIYRPSVVVGDSKTGATQKFDGPYFVMRWLLRQPRVAVLPVLLHSQRYRFNVVPRDFIIAAIERLSASPQSAGKVYQLADPDPMTVDETIERVKKDIADKKITVLAKLFGGQGTINVPSWSPDSKSVAFVSYQLISASDH